MTKREKVRYDDIGRELEKEVRAAVLRTVRPFTDKVTHMQIVDALLVTARVYACDGQRAEKEE